VSAFNLPTASNLPSDFKAKIAKKSRTKGSNYERDVAKKIATYFGQNWNDCFIRTSLSSYAQPQGDLRPINQMRDLWIGAKLGPLECKNRATWTFDQLFKRSENSEIYRWWVKSNDDTDSIDTVLVFTKNGVSDYVMIRNTDWIGYSLDFTHIKFKVYDEHFLIFTLNNFLSTLWPK